MAAVPHPWPWAREASQFGPPPVDQRVANVENDRNPRLRYLYFKSVMFAQFEERGVDLNVAGPRP